uniref:Uncharacterized protein n=1 Tax=Human herpesvirus 2 TaxID=10310 RepID=A0A481TMP6_HHV2|nr:hypothetical protein [Human alphaherpesvirus 2]
MAASSSGSRYVFSIWSGSASASGPQVRTAS